ncbi:SDR family NAD(P)-dependent oxidoreductase [Parachitinimonas caeni]|uniref:SDR family NAD(P)-dependent oxidoreductase n=1 Tax=Parachitinimonas caeni TaxID=3031301 RepID=A0ABT7DU58_9NEIS|nr:SDR family NAD(P)-dependent oxidoreductase [Parachitinimonas caeni]MDK2123592.1 SDR family NAD(P)-dependent oxidoreductase [Parachitinimonas caeni]
MQIENQSFVVSGGASGLGGAVVRMLSAAGAKVVIADVNAAAGEALAQEVGAVFVSTNVTDEASAQAAIDTAVARHGKLDGLVNCAGVAPGERVVGREGPHLLANFQRVIDINLVGSFNMMRLAAYAMSKNTPNAGGERGVVINTASIAGYEGQIGQAAYAASKAGVIGMTLPAARELAKLGIRVVTIAPGIFKTPMMASMSQEIQDSLGAQTPFPARLGEPDEYAALVRHVFENAMINGETIRLDGALRLAPR